MISGNALQIILVVVAVLLIAYLVINYSDNTSATHTQVPQVTENFYAGDSMPEVSASPSVVATMAPPTEEYSVGASEGFPNNERPKALGDMEATQMNQLPAECYPKDILSSADLLPRDADSAWAQVAPSGQGSLQDKNFLTAGFHVGINTVGQTLRNANYQLRSEPSNPQVKVSPWNMTTIDPDTNRRPMEIGGAM